MIRWNASETMTLLSGCYTNFKACGKKQGLKARKWLSDSPEALTVIPQELSECFLLSRRDTRSGRYSYQMIYPGKSGRSFDQLGLAIPFIIRAKILIQDIWTINLG